jgi:hypothetical protein
MIRVRILAALAVLTAMAFAGPTSAQALQTWVSGTGDDANPCTRVAPCHSFAGAIAKTAANGEISCLDPGGFGSLVITQPVTINCEAGGAVVQAPPGGNGIGIATAGLVTLIGLDVEGPGNIGVSAQGSDLTVIIEHCRVNGFSGTAGVFSSGTHMTIFNSEITNNAVGIEVNDTTAVIERALVSGNAGNGIYLNTPAAVPGQPVTVRVSQTESSHNGGAGFAVQRAGFKATMIIDSSSTAHNATGISVAGAAATVAFAQTTIAENLTGVSESSGGVATSYQNNLLDGNSATGHAANNGAYNTAPLQ